MFEAFCKKTNCIVKSKDILDSSQIFYCCNPNCDAELKVRSIDGKYKANFYSFPGAKKHSSLCNLVYEYASSNKIKMNYSNIDINSIFANTSTSSNSNILTSSTITNSNTPNCPKTVKSLLKFAITNPIDKCINLNNNTLLQDIFLDNRNLFNNYKGFEGIKLILCETVSYNLNSNYIVCKIESKNKHICLNVKLYLDRYILSKIIKYILKKNNNKFSKFPIAILANWINPYKYYIQSTLNSSKHIVYDFKLSKKD